ncbi:MAG: AAA family ATPase [Chlamydiota bacterium]
MSLRILNSPMKIFESVHERFPNLQATVILDPQNTVKMELTLSPEIKIPIIENALDAQVFLSSLQVFFSEMQLYQFSKHSLPCPLLDIARCSLEAPLENWQQFRRVFHENQGGNCIQSIMNYLRGNELEESILSTLGLAPEQLRGPVQERDYSYFKDIPEKLANESLENKNTFFKRMEIKYPTVYEQLLSEGAEKAQRLHPQTGLDFHPITVRKLQESVLGQDEAIRQVVGLLATQRMTIKNGVYLFVGPTGVGKTELATAVSKIKLNRLVSFSMNQYPGEEDFTRFFGSSTGYVGSSDKPHFAKEIEKYETPVTKEIKSAESLAKTSSRTIENVVILFDEMEKVHSKLKQTFLTLFDKGICPILYTEGYSNVTINYKFEKCVFICTSNLYQEEILEAFRHRVIPSQISEMFSVLNRMHPMPSSFAQEFLGRLVVVPFGPIPKGECYRKLLDSKLMPFIQAFQKEISCKEIGFEDKELFIATLENILYGEGTKIRKIADYLQGIRNDIYSKEQELGGLENKKLIFSVNATGPCIKVFQFVESMGVYFNMKKTIQLKPI